MPDRIMFVQLKTGYDADRGPAWIARVTFTRSWRTAYFRGRTLRRVTGTARANHDGNFVDVETGEGFWISGPKRDRTDARYSSAQPQVDPDVRAEYESFLSGARLPGQ
ncbi:hypothetical protein [Nocardioides sp. SYSU DS0651]|uniref:hypothetical protein n=1 Tax=Nocardioides sp. SYSU DS0651 TaxID=3415955 RepID=UPI003F4C3A6A